MSREIMQHIDQKLLPMKLAEVPLHLGAASLADLV